MIKVIDRFYIDANSNCYTLKEEEHIESLSLKI